MLSQIITPIIVLTIGRIIMRIIWNYPTKEERIAKFYGKHNGKVRKW